MRDLRPYFITTKRPFREGAVEVFSQKIEGRGTATLTITALGLYEAEINGKKVGEDLFTPGFTYYPKHVNVQIYDVTPLLNQESASVLTVYLAQGWYCGRFTFENKCQIYGEAPAVSWVLEVGGKIYTSRDGVQAENSPYDYAGFYDGEICNEKRRGEIFPPVPFDGPFPERFERTILTAKVREEILPAAVMERGEATIIDFGQNFAGIVLIHPDKMEASSLKLCHGEILNRDGSLYRANLRKAKAETVYYRGEATYRPRFTYMGFRYVELSGCRYVPGLLTAHAIYSDMEPTGSFSCSHPLVDQLFKNQLWGQKSNYVEVPTDCPQRDERMGYTGDGQAYARTGAYNFDTRLFWKKFLLDIRDSQEDNTEGYVAPTVPARGREGIGFLSMLGWGNCVTIVPRMLYEMYGDDSFLRSQYGSMKTFVDCELKRMGEAGLWEAPSLGDWLMPGKEIAWMAAHHGPVSNAFIVNDLRILSKAAGAFGFMKDAVYYKEALEKTQDAYIRRYTNEDGTMKDEYQGAYVMALCHVIPPGELWNRLFANLVKNIRENGMQTGFFSTEHILGLLADHGEGEMAVALLLQEECPGWMYQVKNGATTIWERWDALRPDGTVNETSMGDDNMVSFNHYAFGSVGRFYYEHLLGIRPLKPGFSKISIAPLVSVRLGAVAGEFRSVRGRIRSAWKVEGERVIYDIETPVEAEIRLADKSCRQVKPGGYQFFCDYAILDV